MQAEQTPLTPQNLEARTRLRIRWLLDDQRGREIARDILRWSGCEGAGFAAGATADERAYSDGQRQVGLQLRAMLKKYAPEGWLQLETERLAEELEAARAAEEAQAAKEREQGTGN